MAVRALVRYPARAGELAGLAGVEVAAGDMARPDTLADALDGVDRAMLISSSDPYMAHVQTTFIDAAAKAGVAHIVKLSGITGGHSCRRSDALHPPNLRAVGSLVADLAKHA